MKKRPGGIANVHYVADWDGKGRSNSEEEPMRSTWTDRTTGKVIDLHNYEFAAGSGWNGYALNFTGTFIKMLSTDILTQSRYECTNGEGNPYMLFTNNNVSVPSFRIRVTGRTAALSCRYMNEDNVWSSYDIPADGEYVLPASQAKTGSGVIGFLGRQAGLVIEQLPLYPGALVSDGVDDYGKTREALTEEVGTALIHMADINPKPSVFYYNIPTPNNNEPGRLYFYSEGTNLTPYAGNPNMNIGHDPIRIFRRSPIATPALPLYISTVIEGSLCQNYALYRLILIREQLDDAQAEFLKWKVEKEYRDWCKKNGYEYAINQLTE